MVDCKGLAMLADDALLHFLSVFYNANLKYDTCITPELLTFKNLL